jgi:hypothetical protein
LEIVWRCVGRKYARTLLLRCEKRNFFDAKSVIQESGGQVRVWTKCLVSKETESVELDKTNVEKGAQKIANGYVPPIITIGVMKFNQIVEVVVAEEIANLGNIKPIARILWEFNCVEQRERRLSTYEGFSRKPSDWDYIAPETNMAYLHKILCR